MKKLFVFCIVVVSHFFISAQVATGSGIGPGEMSMASPYGTTQIFVTDPSEDPVQGHRYYEERNKLAVVYINDKRARRCLIRYNAFNDEIEVTENDKVFNILKLDDIKIVLEDDEYFYKIFDSEEGKRFFILRNKGKVSFAKRVEKSVKLGKVATSGYEKDTPSKYVTKRKYFIINEKGEVKNIKKLKKKDILALLDKKTELEQYATSEKLSFKNEEDLVKIIDYYNTL